MIDLIVELLFGSEEIVKAIDPVTGAMIAAGAAKAISGGIKAWTGKSRRDQAREDREELMENQPQYTTPESLDQLTGMYGDYLSEVERREGMPGQGQMEQNLKEQTSSRVRDVRQTARSSTEALGATTDLISQEMENLQQLDIQGAQYQAEQELQARQMYGQSLQQQAEAEDRAWRYNEWLPWKTELAQAQANVRGGQRTMEAGIEQGVSGVVQGGGAYGMSQFGGNGGGTTEDTSLSNNEYMNQNPNPYMGGNFS